MIFRGIHRSDRPFSDPGGARTHDPMIKSHLLYQLSYGVLCAGLTPVATLPLLAVRNFQEVVLPVLRVQS